MPKILCDVKALSLALASASSVVPARSPKPILQNVLLTADGENGSTLAGTDLEVGTRVRVLGVKVDEPGRFVLPPAKLGAILRGCLDSPGRGKLPETEVSIESDGQSLTIRGMRTEFTLAAEDPDLYPDVPDFDAVDYLEVSAGDFRNLIRRTVYATDVESTRYALGGCMFEPGDDSLTVIATDGRRLSRQKVAAEAQGQGLKASGVIPVKALKLIDRLIDPEDVPVHFSLTDKAAMARTDTATVYTRLVEGRFPRYQDVFPADGSFLGKAVVSAGTFLWAAGQAAITTSEESRGVDFTFSPKGLEIRATAADVGKSAIDVDLAYQGPDLCVTFDPRYLTDFLRAFDPETDVVVRLIDDKNAVVFEIESGYSGVVMPLTRDR